MMMITKRFEIKPTKEQEEKMFQTLYLCRKLYNNALDQRQTYYKKHEKGLTYTDQQNQLPAFKNENLEYKQVQSQVLQNALRRLDDAYENFFEKRAGYPRFKDKYHYTSFTYPQAEAKRNFGKEGYIYLSKIGHVKLNNHRDFEPSKVKIINVKFHNNKWYVNLTMEVEEEKLTSDLERCIGIDMGIKYIVITSDGQTYDNPKWLNKSENKFKKLQRQLSRKIKGSNNREKAKKHLQKLHAKITDQRRDYLHKVSINLVKENDLICIEDLQTINMMKNHKLAKSIANVSWNKLALYLEYKSKLYGKNFVKINPKNTSQLCSSCGKPVEKGLSDRVHDCPFCGLVLDRDHNAAINILHKGLEMVMQ
ncbi:MAG: transposase [Halanaerobiales bacterium]|nr:transposase [Halanaerobiales bacterium]